MSSITDPLGQLNSLVTTLNLLQGLEHLLLTVEEQEQPVGNLEGRVHRLELIKTQMKCFNTERIRILEQLRQNVCYHVTVEQNNAFAMRQGFGELREGLNALHQRMNSMSEDITCSICLAPWTSQGGHRVVSLKCGHLFGSSCIRTAIRRSHRCPVCRRRAQYSDVRRIFSRRFFP
ncbi:ERAD-associated E3 ubiquitin-protein ligase HRD1 [Drosophila rhopaloa]|uniref:ERAD-associated E3 ubiquitin-protein ligase HRD1 n=1 Tax=Drosophila rhopaloa TaxID=1041015 RepID=A0A6P4F1B8_DRORH|nr:ERAD-associated E3 ubiquitin-protein ligase HRD1 [Drosophila rhopaloa]